MTKIKTKQEKREEIAKKLKIKAKKGGTLAGQLTRTKTAGHYLKNKKSA